MSKRILIVEDEESIADLEKDYLELSNFEVEVANDGDTGLQKGLGGDFDLIILDLMLPGVDGFEICRQIRDQKNTPIIMVSAKKDDIDKIQEFKVSSNKRWTDEEKQILKDMTWEGYSTKEIQQYLPNRSMEAIKTKKREYNRGKEK